MKEGIVLLAQGGNLESSQLQLEKIVNKVKKNTKNQFIEVAFLENSEESLEKAVVKLVLKGFKTVYLVPMFLFDGVHLKSDIPDRVKSLKNKYSKINIKITEHIGLDDRISDIVVDIINSL